jgi:hypothetical protein
MNQDMVNPIFPQRLEHRVIQFSGGEQHLAFLGLEHLRLHRLSERKRSSFVGVMIMLTVNGSETSWYGSLERQVFTQVFCCGFLHYVSEHVF